MAFTFTDLKYGWKIAAGITLAATTIYIASNTRERVNEADIIELVLGTTERCLATQYSTNPVAYYVDPPSFIRSWYCNDYVTTNVPSDLVTNWTVVLHTNTFTNVIGWRTDRAMMVELTERDMMVELDAKIKALVPHYADTNTVYDGTTNIVMLTVTGLWASLGIGDGTNQFTSVPASGTNAATYGVLHWRIYKKDLEERYKVLNALKICSYQYSYTTNAPAPPGFDPKWISQYTSRGGTYSSWPRRGETNFSVIKADFEGYWGSYIATNNVAPCSVIYAGYNLGELWIHDGIEIDWYVHGYGALGYFKAGPFPTNGTEYSCIVTARSVKVGGSVVSEFSSQGAIGTENTWYEIINVTNHSMDQYLYSDSFGSISMPDWCADPLPYPGVVDSTGKGHTTEYGYKVWMGPQPVYTNFSTNYFPSGTNLMSTNVWPAGFRYCTNKYW